MAEAAKNTKEKPKKIKRARPRIHLIDELRGIAIFCMIFYHAFYTVGVLFNMGWAMVLLKFFMPAEPYFAGLFILISGVASNLSHSNLERGVKLLFIAFAVTIVTYFSLGKEYMISFGILHMLAVCMMLYGVLNKYLKLVPSALGIIFNVVLFVFTFNVQSGSVGFPFILNIKIPAEWYNTSFLFMFGLPDKNFVSSDYFPLLPWLFLFFAGTYIGRIGMKKKFPKFMYTKRVSFFAFLGRHSLIIYLVHQPVIYGICKGVEWIMSLFPNGSPK